MRTRLWYNQGSAGIVALIIMTVLGVFGAAFVAVSSSEMGISSNHRDGVAAQYLAEAGAQWAIAQIKANPAYTTAQAGVKSGNKNAVPTEGTYKVIVTGTSPNVTIKSVGTVNRSIRTVVLVVTPAGGALGNPIFDYAAFSVGNMVINSPQLNGDIMSNGKITVNSHAANTVLGKAVSSSHTIWSPAAVRDGFVQLTQQGVLDVNSMMIAMDPIPSYTALNTPPVAPPCKDLKTVFAGAEWSGNTFSLTNLSSGGYYYYIGDYGMWGHKYHVPAGQAVTIYIQGNYDIGKDITVDGDLTIYATGNITLNGGSILGLNTSTINFYPRGTFTINNNRKVTGGNITVNSIGDITIGGAIVGSSSAPIKLYTQEDFTMNSAQVSGGDITVNCAHNMTLNSSTLGSNASNIQLFVNRALALNGSSAVNGSTVTVLANNANKSGNAISFNGGSINSTLAGSVAKIYARGNVALNNVSQVAGQGTGMLVSTGDVALNGGSAPKTIVIAQGNVEANKGIVSGIYANGTINMNGATVTYSKSVIETLGVGSSTGETTPFKVISYNYHE